MKRCSQCGADLPQERKHRYCRECIRAYKRQWHRNNRVGDLKAENDRLRKRIGDLQAQLAAVGVYAGVRRVA
jgi:predicted amidophosphoribosyltransferase